MDTATFIPGSFPGLRNHAILERLGGELLGRAEGDGKLLGFADVDRDGAVSDDLAPLGVQVDDVAVGCILSASMCGFRTYGEGFSPASSDGGVDAK